MVAKYHAKAVEQWYADAELVIGGKLHVLTGKETVVGNVVVGQHDAFRESRSAGGVLHVHYIVASDLTFEFIQAAVFYIVAQEKYFGRVVHAPVLLLPHVDDVFHIKGNVRFSSVRVGRSSVPEAWYRSSAQSHCPFRH